MNDNGGAGPLAPNIDQSCRRDERRRYRRLEHLSTPRAILRASAQRRRIGRTIIGASAVALALSFVSLPGGQTRAPPQILALKAVTNAPISSVAPLSGRPVGQLIDDLAKAGINLPNANASIDSMTADDRGL
jgi:hypothetical protein